MPRACRRDRLKNIRYYLSYILTFLLITSISTNLLTYLSKNVLSDYKDIFILTISLIIGYRVARYHYIPEVKKIN